MMLLGYMVHVTCLLTARDMALEGLGEGRRCRKWGDFPRS